MLRTIRLTLAIVFFALVTLLFLDFTGTLHGWMGWMAKIQFLPALLALNAGVVLLLVALTLLFGRVYCSVPVCRQAEEKPFPLFSRQEMAALRNVGSVCHGPRCGRALSCSRLTARTVQLLRTHRFQSLRSRLSVGQ